MLLPETWCRFVPLKCPVLILFSLTATFIDKHTTCRILKKQTDDYQNSCRCHTFYTTFVIKKKKVKVLLKGPAKNWKSTGLTGAQRGLTLRDTTAWSRRSKWVREPPWQYWSRPLLLDLDGVTDNSSPLGHGCGVSTRPSPRMSTPTAVFSGA